jgi:hypothetical protein
MRLAQDEFRISHGNVTRPGVRSSMSLCKPHGRLAACRHFLPTSTRFPAQAAGAASPTGAKSAS